MKPSHPHPATACTHIPAPNLYLLSQLQRANPLTHRRTPFTRTPDSHIAHLQRLVHHQSARPPNRQILLSLRLLTYYPPAPDIIPDLLTLLSSPNLHIARLAHYHIRHMPAMHAHLARDLMHALEAEAASASPARRAAALKTFVKIPAAPDVARATHLLTDAFNNIGGARVKASVEPDTRTLLGIPIPGTHKEPNPVKEPRFKLPSASIVAGEAHRDTPSNAARDTADGAGGEQPPEAEAKPPPPPFVKTKLGKKLVAHAVFAALRRLNRLATREARVESYLVDSGLMSLVPSTVRHAVALLEWRSLVSPVPVSRYLVGRLPHKNPPAGRGLRLQDLGARVYYARLLSSLAEDPNLSVYIPDEAAKAKRKKKRAAAASQSGLARSVKEKASHLFKFLFNAAGANDAYAAVKTRATALSTTTPLKRDDPLGVDFAEALVNLLKNSSNRVMIEALKGLAKRRWTTWFEAPIPQAALYNSPELNEGPLFGGKPPGSEADQDTENESVDDDDNDNDDDDNELGSFEDDIGAQEELLDGEASKLVPADPLAKEADRREEREKETWFSRLTARRKEQRAEFVDKNTPFYLRKVGHGMVPALQVILRRVNAALFQDESASRFAAADAIVILARAKIYGHTQNDHQMHAKAMGEMANVGQSKALIIAAAGGGGAPFREQRHPFQPLVKPLAQLVEEDPNQFVRARAAVALLFVVASGAGRAVADPEANGQVSEKVLRRTAQLEETPLLLRYFRNFVTHPAAGTGVGLRLISELIDHLIYEVLDIAPDLAPSAVDMAELWAMTHPTVGVCGRLGALWEKVLGIGQGQVVGKSIFRCVESHPRTERVASAAIIFLRRRTLDLAIITVGASNIGNALPEPLPRSIGVEMEKYFSLLWHAALLGPSAECRVFAVQALGGAAVLAGEPFRSCTYERIVELVRMRGFGLKIPAEQVLNCLDALYFTRERFSEARQRNRIARDGSNRSKDWLELVWRLAAEASSAAQILLGIAPPTGWQALGGAGQADLKNAEERFGDVRDRQEDEKLKDATVATVAAPDSVPLLEGRRRYEEDVERNGERPDDRHRDERHRDERHRDERHRDERHRDERHRDERHRDDRYQDDRYQDDRFQDDRFQDDRYQDDRYQDDRYQDEGASSSRERRDDGEEWQQQAGEQEDYGQSSQTSRSQTTPSQTTGSQPSQAPTSGTQSDKKKLEQADRELAFRLQENEENGADVSNPYDGPGRYNAGRQLDVMDRAGDMADRLMRQGQKLKSKAMRTAAKHAYK